MTDRVQLTDGSPVPADHSHTELRADGQQKGYIVLSPEERAKGFVKPVRRSYVHIGPPAAPANLRDLTAEEHERYDKFGYVKYEPYPEGVGPCGKYWTQADLDRAGKGCGSQTTMGRSLAETYARDPNFYSGTFCCACGKHYPLDEFVWEDGEPMDTSKQAAWAEQEKQRRVEDRQRRLAQLRHEISRLEAEGES